MGTPVGLWTKGTMSATPSCFYALFLCARYAHVVRYALPCAATAIALRHYTHKTSAEAWRSR